MASYFLASGLAAVTVTGIMFGAVGGLIAGIIGPSIRLPVLLAVCLLLICRECGILAFGLPGPRRQTVGSWFQTYGLRRAAMMWGLDIGMGCTTWIAFGGLWCLWAVILLNGSVWTGIAIMAGYFIGRALPTLAAPVILIRCGLGAPNDAAVVMRVLAGQQSWHRCIQVIGMVAIAIGTWVAQ